DHLGDGRIVVRDENAVRPVGGPRLRGLVRLLLHAPSLAPRRRRCAPDHRPRHRMSAFRKKQKSEMHPPRSYGGTVTTTPAADVDVVLPYLNEAEALPWVLERIPPGWRALVVDNGSTDGSPEVARAYGATVVHEPRRGFGAACHAG